MCVFCAHMQKPVHLSFVFGSTLRVCGMLVVGLTAQKGGVGKTTIALHLAVQSQTNFDSVALIDTDPQGSAASWARRRHEVSGISNEPATFHVPKERELEDALTEISKEGYKLAFVDTRPSVSSAVALAVSCSDIVLVPCCPSPQDLDALASTIRLVEREEVPAYIILNRARGPKINASVVDLIESNFSTPVCPVMINHRYAMADTFFNGLSIVEDTSETQSVLNGQQEIKDLWKWLRKQLRKM